MCQKTTFVMKGGDKKKGERGEGSGGGTKKTTFVKRNSCVLE